MDHSHWLKKIQQWTPFGRRGRPQQSWNNQVKNFTRIRNMEEDMAEDKHLWRLGMDRQLLDNNNNHYYLFIYLFIYRFLMFSHLSVPKVS